MKRVEVGDSVLNSNSGKIFVGIASIPARVDSLKIAIDSIYNQVDIIGVYLNHYELVPSFYKEKNYYWTVPRLR
jgi:hypothetical protein